MLSSRGMGAINPSKMPSPKKVKRKDNPNTVDVYKEGGTVNAAGNYTKQFVAQPKRIAKKTAGYR